jgi:hypothetical protein
MRKYNYEFCRETALKYDTPISLKEGDSGVHYKIYKEGWMELLSHMATSGTRRRLTYDFCKETASRYDSLSGLRDENGGVLGKIRKQGWNELISHIPTEFDKRILEFDENRVFEPHEYYLNHGIRDIEGESWVDIRDYEGLYMVSNMGRVKSLSRISGKSKGKPETIKRGFVQHKGYVKVQLNKENTHKNHFMHRLVISHFMHESKLEVNHRNMVKTDNRLENLEYVTGKENVNHATRMTGRVWHHTIGEKNHGARRVLGICKETKEIRYDIPYVEGVYEMLPADSFGRDLRGLIRRSLKERLFYLDCIWVYCDEYEKGNFNPSHFKEPERSKTLWDERRKTAYSLFSDGKRVCEVSRITGFPNSVVRRYWKRFKEETKDDEFRKK